MAGRDGKPLSAYNNRDLLTRYAEAYWETIEYPGNKKRQHRFYAYKNEVLRRMSRCEEHAKAACEPQRNSE